MDEKSELIRCDHIPCGCYVPRCDAVIEGGGAFCHKHCAKHPFTGNKCSCNHPECR
jgi:hypothetical protein